VIDSRHLPPFFLSRASDLMRPPDGLPSKSLPHISLAAPHPITHIESHPYKNHRGAGYASSTLGLFDPCTLLLFDSCTPSTLALFNRSFVALCIKSVSQLLYHQLLPHSLSKLPGCHPLPQFPFWYTQSGFCEANSKRSFPRAGSGSEWGHARHRQVAGIQSLVEECQHA
jgi:hypothetical protein